MVRELKILLMIMIHIRLFHDGADVRSSGSGSKRPDPPDPEEFIAAPVEPDIVAPPSAGRHVPPHIHLLVVMYSHIHLLWLSCTATFHTSLSCCF